MGRGISVGLLLIATAIPLYSGGGQNGNSQSFNPNLDFAQVEYVKATESSSGVWRFDY